MAEPSSYRTILRSSAIVGGAQVVNILSGLLKMKAAAILLGPAGVGLVGLYQNLMQTAGSVAARTNRSAHCSMPGRSPKRRGRD